MLAKLERGRFKKMLWFAVKHKDLHGLLGLYVQKLDGDDVFLLRDALNSSSAVIFPS
jgi:hypothetical protein